jgi:molecular chaperone DnaK
VPQIEVTFDIDANGIVHVSAKDLGTGKEQKIRIESSSGLSEEEIKKMVNDAELHAEEDKKERESAEARNEADNLIYATEKSLSDYGDKITEDDKKKIEDAVQDLKKSLEGGDIQEIKNRTETLKQASFSLAEEVYKATSAQAGQAGEADASGTTDKGEAASGNQENQEAGESKDNVEDVDYEVVDDEDSKGK